MKRFKVGDEVVVKKITNGKKDILFNYKEYFNKIAVIYDENVAPVQQRWDYKIKFDITGDTFYVHEEDIEELPYKKTELYKALNGE
jgi:hypothetical protein